MVTYMQNCFKIYEMIHTSGQLHNQVHVAYIYIICFNKNEIKYNIC